MALASTWWARTSRPARRCSWTTPCSRCTRARSARFSATRDSTTTCGSAARPRAWASRRWRAAAALRLTVPIGSARCRQRCRRYQGRARCRQARAAPCPDARPDAARSAHPTGARPESAGDVGKRSRSSGPRWRRRCRRSRVLRGPDPRRSEEQLGRFDEAGSPTRAPPPASRRAVGRDRPQPRRPGAGAGARRAEDPRRGRRPACDRAADPWADFRLHDPDADTLLEAWRATEVMVQPSRRLRMLGLALAAVAGVVAWRPPAPAAGGLHRARRRRARRRRRPPQRQARDRPHRRATSRSSTTACRSGSSSLARPRCRSTWSSRSTAAPASTPGSARI